MQRCPHADLPLGTHVANGSHKGSSRVKTARSDGPQGARRLGLYAVTLLPKQGARRPKSARLRLVTANLPSRNLSYNRRTQLKPMFAGS